MRSFITFLLTLATIRRLSSLFLLLALLLTVACALPELDEPEPPPPHHTRPVSRQPQAKPADPKAQQFYYDLGLQRYSEENYVQAEQAFQQAVENGPGTPLGIKAQENLKKTQQILKTLREMESK